MEFKYKGEDILVELDQEGHVKWVYAYNMRMCFNVVPYDLKQEINYLLAHLKL